MREPATPSRFAWNAPSSGTRTPTPTVSSASSVVCTAEMPIVVADPCPHAPLLPPALTDRLPASLAAALYRCLGQLPPGAGEPEEIRLRAGRYVVLTIGGENHITELKLDGNDLSEILSALCGGSLYAYSQEIAQGFLTLPDGIRVGVAGQAACENGQVLGLRSVTGLCIRLPHSHRAVGDRLVRMIRDSLVAGSPRGLLLYGAPGVGKTTLLRSIAVGLASPPAPLRTVLVDSRAELCYGTTDPKLCLDVLIGYPRALGVEIATRTLSAQVILCDEIGSCAEAMSLTEALHGGVPLIASAHAADCSELLHRTGLRLLHEARLFFAYVGLTRDGLGGFRYRVTSWDTAEALLSGPGQTGP